MGKKGEGGGKSRVFCRGPAALCCCWGGSSGAAGGRPGLDAARARGAPTPQECGVGSGGGGGRPSLTFWGWLCWFGFVLGAGRGPGCPASPLHKDFGFFFLPGAATSPLGSVLGRGLVPRGGMLGAGLGTGRRREAGEEEAPVPAARPGAGQTGVTGQRGHRWALPGWAGGCGAQAVRHRGLSPSGDPCPPPHS